MGNTGNSITGFLAQYSVNSLLYAGEKAADISDLLVGTQISLHACSGPEVLHLDQRFDFALLYDCLEHLSKSEGTRIVGHLRNAISPRIWLIGSGGKQWQFGDYVALGFKSLPAITLHGQTVENYFYDLATYNKKRDWNNPKNWANPENWNKYRW